MSRLLATSILLAGCANPPLRGVWRSAPDVEWESLFQSQESAWRGGDAVYSVPLGPGRVLWLFGDSFIASPGSVARSEVHMVRNSLAIQTPPGPPVFHWRTVDGKPSAAFPPPGPGRWIWPLGGYRDGPRLHLFFTELLASEKDLGFSSTGNLLLTIDNPDDPPAAWRMERQPIPFSRHTSDGDRVYGAAVVAHEGQFYVFGTREDWKRGAGGRGLILARTPSLPDFSRWQFLTVKGWSSDPEAPRELFLEVATEMSVSVFPATGEFMVVYTWMGIKPEVLYRRAPRPEGPWSQAAIVFRAPEPSWNARYYAYAGKAHPEISREPNEILISYAANSQVFGDLFKDLRLYWPRFVRASLH